MPIYRVTFTTSLLVDAQDEWTAEHVGEQCLVDEVRNGTSEVYNTEEVTTQAGLRAGEVGSLPWRDLRRRDEPEVTVDEIIRNGTCSR